MWLIEFVRCDLVSRFNSHGLTLALILLIGGYVYHNNAMAEGAWEF